MPVYSTDKGRLCPTCSQPSAQCRCKAATTVSTHKDGKARISLEKKGRGGKTVSLVSGLGMEPKELQSLAKSMRQFCGCGGRVVDGVIEIQGDQRSRIKAFLQKQGIPQSG